MSRLDQFPTEATTIENTDLLHLKRGTGTNSDKKITGANVKAQFATAAQGAKVDFLTVTQAVDLDTIEARVNALDAAVVLRGSWDASVGTFPGGGTAQAGDSYIVSVAGTVDSISFNINDRILAILDNASTTIFAANWLKLDYTDQVLSVAGLTGAILASALRTALNVEDGATADQSNAEIEAAYNAQVAVVSQVDAEAGTSTDVKRWTPQRVAQAIAALGGSGGGGLTPIFVTSSTAYAASNNDLCLCDTQTDEAGVMLPASPADKTRIDVLGGPYASVNRVYVSSLDGDDINNVAEDFYIDQNWGQCRFIWNATTSNWDIFPIGFPDIITTNTVFIIYKNTNYTANPGERVMTDPTSAPLTITLPATPTAGDAVGVWDISGVADVNNISIARNGSTIMGAAADDTLDIANGHFEYAYNGTTWKRSFWAPGGLQLEDVVGRQRVMLRPDVDLSLIVSGTPATLVTKAFTSESMKAYRCSNSAFNNIGYIWIPPPRWNGGSIRYRIIWTPTSTVAGNVNFNVIMYYGTDDEELTLSGGLGGVTDTVLSSITKLHISPWSAWLSMPFTYGDFVHMKFYGRGGSAEWTTTASADILAIEYEYTTDAPTDD